VLERITYKLAVLVYECFYMDSCQPTGLTFYTTACHWTSWSTTPAFVIELSTGYTTDTALYTIGPKGDRAFSVAAAKTWNSSQSELVTEMFYL